MKFILTILLIGLFSCSKSQSGFIGKRVYDTIGNIFNVAFDASSGSLFTRSGSNGTWTYGSGGLSISGTGSSVPTDYIEYTNWYTDLEKNTCELIFTPTVDGDGIGIGYIGSSGRNYYGTIVLTGSTRGQLRFESVITGALTNRANSGTNYFNVTNGQQHKLTLVRTPALITFTVTNTVTLATQTLNYAPAYSSIPLFDTYKCGRMGILWSGGSQTVTNFRYYSPIVKNPRLLFTGDSNMAGAVAGTNADRYTQLLAASVVGRIEVDAGAGNTSQDIVNLLPEILLMKPRALFVNIGTNGITQINIDTIRNRCQRNNIAVYLSTIFPTTGGVNANNSIIRGESGVILVDFDPTLLNGGSALYAGYSYDGTHINTAGNTAVFNKIATDLASYLNQP